MADSGAANNDIDMLHGSLWDKILIFALPLAASSMVQQLFNSVDAAVVGTFSSSQALAAVGSNGSIIALIITVFVGISVGANVVIANGIGRGEDQEIKDSVHTAMSVAILSGVLLLIVGQVAARPILTFMSSPEDVIELASTYLRIIFLGMPFMMVYNFGAAILRSKGDTTRPFICLLVSGLINVGLNLLLVITFQMSVMGVAIATVVSQFISAIFVTFWLVRESGPMRLDIPHLYISAKSLRAMVRIGVPAGISGMLFSVSNVLIQGSVNALGSYTAAGNAAALHLEIFTFFLMSGFSQAAVTFTSQNFGAMEFDRCKRIYKMTMIFGVVFTGALCLVMVIFRDLFISFYTTDAEVASYASTRVLWVLSLSWLPALYEVSAAVLRGLGCSLTPTVITLFGTCIIRLIWLFTIYPMYVGYLPLIMIYPITWVITSAMMISALLVMRKKQFASYGG